MILCIVKLRENKLNRVPVKIIHMANHSLLFLKGQCQFFLGLLSGQGKVPD